MHSFLVKFSIHTHVFEKKSNRAFIKNLIQSVELVNSSHFQPTTFFLKHFAPRILLKVSHLQAYYKHHAIEIWEASCDNKWNNMIVCCMRSEKFPLGFFSSSVAFTRVHVIWSSFFFHALLKYITRENLLMGFKSN